MGLVDTTVLLDFRDAATLSCLKMFSHSAHHGLFSCNLPSALPQCSLSLRWKVCVADVPFGTEHPVVSHFLYFDWF